MHPPVVAGHRNAPVNAPGYLRAMFTVSDIDDTLARLRKRGAQLVGEVVQYENAYRLCYVRGPEGLLIGLAQPLGGHRQRPTARDALVLRLFFDRADQRLRPAIGEARWP